MMMTMVMKLVMMQAKYGGNNMTNMEITMVMMIMIMMTKVMMVTLLTRFHLT